jgi:hypothetical protein
MMAVTRTTTIASHEREIAERHPAAVAGLTIAKQRARMHSRIRRSRSTRVIAGPRVSDDERARFVRFVVGKTYMSLRREKYTRLVLAIT